MGAGADAAAETRCQFVETHLDNRAECHYMGKRGEEWTSVLITPRRTISPQIAADMLMTVTTAFDMSAYHPATITILTDPAGKGDSLKVEGANAHLPNAIDPQKVFRKGILRCRAVNWDEKCAPFSK